MGEQKMGECFDRLLLLLTFVFVMFCAFISRKVESGRMQRKDLRFHLLSVDGCGLTCCARCRVALRRATSEMCVCMSV